MNRFENQPTSRSELAGKTGPNLGLSLITSSELYVLNTDLKSTLNILTKP